MAGAFSIFISRPIAVHPKIIFAVNLVQWQHVKSATIRATQPSLVRDHCFVTDQSREI
jgi:hypothetical protein